VAVIKRVADDNMTWDRGAAPSHAVARLLLVRLESARHGTARRGTARCGVARRGAARCGAARQRRGAGRLV